MNLTPIARRAITTAVRNLPMALIPRCVNPTLLQRYLIAVQDTLERAIMSLNSMEMELLRLSSVSSERSLGRFLDASGAVFSGSLRRSVHTEYPGFIQSTRENLLPTGSTPASQPDQIHECRNTVEIVNLLRESERRLATLDRIFDRLTMTWSADMVRLVNQVLPMRPSGEPLEEPPAQLGLDPAVGRRGRMLSAAEQATFSMIDIARQELGSIIPLLVAARTEIVRVAPLLVRYAVPPQM